jgi:WYL_2, Sm-like SH3 beta-barrel fold
MEKAELKELLHKHVVEVTFTKVDGSVRIMPCTLMESLLPPAPAHVSGTDNPIDFPKVRKVNEANLSVWCTDKNEWRSFKVDNVISAKILS